MNDEAKKELQPMSAAEQWARETEAKLNKNPTWAAARARLAAGRALPPSAPKREKT